MAKVKLGNGWYEAVDQASGRTYYIHKDRRITQWNRPTDEELGLAGAAEAGGGANGAAASSPAASPTAAKPAGKWEKRVDKKSGKTYYVNKTTRQSQWEVPDGFEDGEGGGGTSAAAGATKKKKKKSHTIKHGDWQVRKDKKGRVYYANTKTMLTQWDMPAELEGVDLTFPPDEGEAAAGATAPAAASASAANEDEEDGEGGDAMTPLPAHVVQKKHPPRPIRTTDSYFNMHDIDSPAGADTSRGGGAGGGGGAAASPAIPAASSGGGGAAVAGQFDDLGAYILKHTGAVTVNAIDGRRTNRGWGDNVVIDLRDIVDVHIDDATLQHDFEEFAAMKYNPKYKGGPGVLAFDGKPVTVPLLAKLKTPALAKSAVQMSKNITGFIGTRKTSKAGFSHAEKIFHFVLEDVCEETTHDNIPLLWDEIYCQVVRVSALGPEVDPEVTLKAWQLMAVLASVFPCSKGLFPYLMSWCEKVKKAAPSKHVADLAWYSQKALRRGQDLPFRKLVPPVVPTDMEISSILDSKECCVRVFTVNGHSRVLPVASWTTASEVCRIMARSLGIRDRKCFRLFIADEVKGQRVLDEDARVLDVMAQLQYEVSQEKGVDLERVRQGQMSATLLFKAEFYGRVNPSDPEALAYLFEQSIQDVIRSHCALPLSAAVDLGSIHAYEEAARRGVKVAELHIESMLFRYVPSRLLQKVSTAERVRIAAAVSRRAHALQRKQYTLVAAHVAYLEYLAKMPWYGAESFLVEAVKIYHGIPAKFQLSITPSWVLVVDIESRRILHILDWTMLRNYGGKERFLKFKLRAEGMEEIMFFHTEEGDDTRILRLLDVYKLHKI